MVFSFYSHHTTAVTKKVILKPLFLETLQLHLYVFQHRAKFQREPTTRKKVMFFVHNGKRVCDILLCTQTMGHINALNRLIQKRIQLVLCGERDPLGPGQHFHVCKEGTVTNSNLAGYGEKSQSAGERKNGDKFRPWGPSCSGRLRPVSIPAGTPYTNGFRSTYRREAACFALKSEKS